MTGRWERPDFAAEAEDWARGALRSAGLGAVRAFEEVKLRAWSAVFRATCSHGVAYFKAAGPAGSYEPALVARLAELWPERVPSVIATWPERGWLLVEDGGPTLREVRSDDSDFSHWERVLPLYAELQRESAEHLDTWFAIELPDRRPERLPALVADLASDERALTSEERGALRAALSHLPGRLAELAELSLPAAIDHGDLHDANVLVGASGYRFFDWGDSCLTHPFFSLAVTFNALDPDAKARARLADAYLEPWRAVAPRAVLRAALERALRLGAFTRALDWRAVLEEASPAQRAEWSDHLAAWLRRCL